MLNNKTEFPETPELNGVVVLGALLLFWSSVALIGCSSSNAKSPEDTSGSDDHKPCTETTNAAANACQFEVDDDYWIALGKCSNVTEAEERKACETDAEKEREDGLDECKEITAARGEVCAALGEAAYDPAIEAADFIGVDGIIANPNPYFPLLPGTEWVYEAADQTITVTVTDKTRVIEGITTVEVHDVVTEDGKLVEDTDDWYAQDTSGNVWYFGEIARNYEDGELVDLEGTWKAGRDEAKIGIVMQAVPQTGQVYRQEFLLGDAEDMAEVIDTAGTESAPAGNCTGNCLVTKEYSPLEPDVEEHKYYAPGVGLILEIDPETGDRTELVSFTKK